MGAKNTVSSSGWAVTSKTLPGSFMDSSTALKAGFSRISRPYGTSVKAPRHKTSNKIGRVAEPFLSSLCEAMLLLLL